MSEIYSFGEWVRRRRRALDQTQAVLAEQVGCAASMIRKIEADERRPSRQVAELLADALQVPAVERDQFLRTARAELAPDQLLPPSDVVTSPPATSPAPRGNLPLSLTSFVGRETEIAAIQELLTRHRLVTLTGPGGTGKTRLALEVGAGIQTSFEHGVWMVELAALSDSAVIPQTVANVFELREESGRPIQNVLSDFLRERSLLLVLDNCEHLVEASAILVNTLLRSCSQVRVLATSRERLGVGGEMVYRVPALRVPELQNTIDRVLIERYEAIRLFVERARLVVPEFVLNDSNLQAVIQVCERLDGIPLAIELAAARVAMLRVEQIAERLHDRFRLLVTTNRTALPRQQTLRALIDWSYDLLSEQEQVLFQRLGVFAGGWMLEAAEAIVTGESDHINVLDGLTRLVDKSLVQAERVVGQETRYHMLETIREYALEQLDLRACVDTVRQRHCMYFAQFAVQASSHSQRHDTRTWFQQLDVELDNLRAAMDWAFSVRETQLAADIVLALSGRDWNSFWHWRGYWTEGRRLIERLLTYSDTLDSVSRAWALVSLADSDWLFDGDLLTIQMRRQEAFELFQHANDEEGIAWIIEQRGTDAWQVGDYEQSMDHLKAAHAINERIGNMYGVATTLHHMGDVARDQGDIPQANEFLNRSLDLCREHGFVFHSSAVLNGLGDVACLQSRLDDATTLFWQAFEIQGTHNEHTFGVWPLRNLGWVSLMQGIQQPILDWLQLYCWKFEERSVQAIVATLQHIYGATLFRVNRTQEALAYLREALQRQQRIQFADLQIETIELVAVLANGDGLLSPAVRLLSAATMLRSYHKVPRPPASIPLCLRTRAQLVNNLGSEQFEHEWHTGEALTLEQGVSGAFEILHALALRNTP